MMVKKTFAAVMAPVLLLALAGAALAQWPARAAHIRRHQTEQQRRIYQGIRSGELTRGEAGCLEWEQRGIWLDRREARADGTFSGAERAEIRQDQRQASRHIYRAKHNCRDRD